MADILTPAEALSALEQCYADFADKTLTLSNSATLRDTLVGLVWESPVKRSREALLDQFHTDVQEHVAALVAAEEACGPEERGRCAARAVEQMLFPSASGDQSLDFALVAVEGLAEPLLPLLDREALAELAQRFQARTPKRMMFPSQRARLKAMQRLCG